MVFTVLSPVVPVIDRLPTEMFPPDRSNVSESLPVPQLADRFPDTPELVTMRGWPLMVVPSVGVSRITLGAGWLITTLLAPLSVIVRLPPTRLVAMLAISARPSSDSRPGQKRFFLARAFLRRPLRPSNLSMILSSNIRNLLCQKKVHRSLRQNRTTEARLRRLRLSAKRAK